MIDCVLLDAAGRRRSPATLPGYHCGRPPRNKGLRYPADPPPVEEIVAVMRVAGGTAHGRGPERGYSREHRELRKRFGLVVAVGAAVCARCGRFIDPREPSDLGHDDLDRSRYTGPKHRRCNRGATAGRARRRIASRAWCRTRTSRRSSWTTGTSTSEPYEPPTAPRHANGPSVAFNTRASRAAWGGEPRALTSVLLASLGVKLAVAARALQIVAHHTVLSVPVTYCAWGGVENTSGHLHGIAGRIVLSRSATRASRASVSA